MFWKENKPYLVVIILMAVTSAAIYRFGDVSEVTTASVNVNLPSAIGVYDGKDVLFCSSESCGRSFVVSEGAEMQLCPVCHAPLDVMSPAERAILPSGTVVMKKIYTSPTREPISVSVVISGTDRLGIHRPQNCLPGQGIRISRTTRVPVKIAGRDDLKITLLELEKTGDTADGAAHPPRHSSMAYWYFGGEHETPYQSSMMFWMAHDRIFFNKSERWAYISIVAPRNDDSDGSWSGLADFISMLYPVMRKTVAP